MPVEDTEDAIVAAIPHEHVIFTDLDGIEGVLVDLNTKKILPAQRDREFGLART